MSVIDTLNMRQGSKISHAELIAVLSDPISTEAVRHYVLQTMLPHTVVETGDIDHLISLLAAMERQPRHVIVDISESTMPLSDLTRLAEVCEPDVSVIVIGDRNDVGLFRDLLRMGVADYISKPLTPDLLQRCIHIDDAGSVEPVQAARTGKVMAFVGARGGIGTSTIAANTAWFLAQQARRRVAMIDFDLHGGQSSMLLGAESNNSLVDVLDNVARLDPQYMERTLTQIGDRLYLLSADLDLTEDYSPSTSAMARILEVLARHFHYVIVDLPDRAGYLSQFVLEHAHAITIVSDSSVRSARETARLLRFAESRETVTPPKLILNTPWQPTKGSLRVSDFEQAVGRAPSYVLPFDPQSITQSENLGEPVINKLNPFSEALQAMLHELLGNATTKKKQPWWQKLLGRRKT